MWVFVRDINGNWIQQGNKLVGTRAVADEDQGWSVPLSSDGNTILVGGPNLGPGEGNSGGVWVFTRDQDVNWTQQGGKLVGGNEALWKYQGYSVAISADGNTALEGGIGDNKDIGAAWVFTRNSHGDWTQASKLVGTGAVSISQQGWAVALSADGKTAMEGGPADNGGVGAVWVFTRDSSGDWIQQGSKLTGSGAVGAASQGDAVSLSSDGNTALVSGPGDNNGVGAVRPTGEAQPLVSTLNAPTGAVTANRYRIGRIERRHLGIREQ